MARRYTEVFKFILVTTLLYYSGKCNSEPEDAFVANINNRVLHNYNLLDHDIGERFRLLFNRARHHALPFEHISDKEKKVGADDLDSRKGFMNRPLNQHLLLPRRLIRQAYAGYKPNLYPTLPTQPPSYNHQPYYNNFPQSNQTSYTPPYNPQWQPTNIHNHAQTGYPGNSGNYPGNASPYNPTYPYNNPQPSAPVYPNSADYPIFGHSHGHRYPYSPTNYTNFGPQNPLGYQPTLNSSNLPSNWSSHGNRNNSFTYNPSQRPPYYPSGNSTQSTYRPGQPPYSATQKYPVPSFNPSQRTPTPYNYSNQFGSFNRSQTGFFPYRPSNPGYNNTPGLGGNHGPYNNGPYYPNHNGFQPVQFNTNASFPNNHQTWPYNASHNGYRPNTPVQYPSGPYVNNNANQGQSNFYGYNMTRPNSYPGVSFTGNNFTQSYNGYPGNGVPGNGFYPKPQYNGTSTYRLADQYSPNIPNQPPPNNNFGYHNSFYPSNATLDPTRVSPHRFSY